MKLKDKEMERYRTYHVQGGASYNKCRVNAVVFHMNGVKEHEMAKASKAYDLIESGSKIITEAVRNKRDEKGNARRVDLVDLTTGIEWEIETSKKRAQRFKNDSVVKVIKLYK